MLSAGDSTPVGGYCYTDDMINSLFIEGSSSEISDYVKPHTQTIDEQKRIG